MENGVCHYFIKTFRKGIHFQRPRVGDRTELYFSSASGHNPASPVLCTLHLAVCAVAHACGAIVSSTACLNVTRLLLAR